MRGAIGPKVGLFEQAAREIKDILVQEGVARMPLGLDVCEPPMLFALQEQGIDIRDGQQMMMRAREIKSHDEITLLNIAASMVDGVYHDIAADLRPERRNRSRVARNACTRWARLRRGINAIGARAAAAQAQLQRRMSVPVTGVLRHHPCVHRHRPVTTAVRGGRRAGAKDATSARASGGCAIGCFGGNTRTVARNSPSRPRSDSRRDGRFRVEFCHGRDSACNERPRSANQHSTWPSSERMVFRSRRFAREGRRLAARIEKSPHARGGRSFRSTPHGAPLLTHTNSFRSAGSARQMGYEMAARSQRAGRRPRGNARAESRAARKPARKSPPPFGACSRDLGSAWCPHGTTSRVMKGC